MKKYNHLNSLQKMDISLYDGMMKKEMFLIMKTLQTISTYLEDLEK